MKIKKVLKVTAIIFLFFFLSLFLIRFFSHKEIDDITPGIPCEDKYIQKADVLWVIPNFHNTPISNNPEWCKYFLSLNKTLGMHGVTHEYEEFKTNRNQEYLNKGIDSFVKCFGFKPEIFKPPQLAISKQNKELIKKNNLKLKLNFNQLTHKVYHCNDTGVFPNWFIDLF